MSGQFVEIEEALRADHVPPAGQQHQLRPRPSATMRSACALNSGEPFSGEEARALASGSMSLPPQCAERRTSAGVCGMVGDVPHRQHAAVAVADDHRSGEAALGDPSRREAIVGDRLRDSLEGGAFRRAAVADREDVVSAAVEGEAGVAELRQRRRQEARRAAVEIHGVAVKQQHRAFARSALGLVPCALQRHGVRRDRPSDGHSHMKIGIAGAERWARRSRAALKRSGTR